MELGNIIFWVLMITLAITIYRYNLVINRLVHIVKKQEAFSVEQRQQLEKSKATTAKLENLINKYNDCNEKN